MWERILRFFGLEKIKPQPESKPVAFEEPDWERILRDTPGQWFGE